MRDDIPRRGFSRERHARLKLAISGAALAGFALAWLGFSSAHNEGFVAAPAASVRSATASMPGSATTSAPPTEPAATPTRARTSRGS